MSKEALSKSWLTKKEVIDSLYDGFMYTAGAFGTGFAANVIFRIAKPSMRLEFADVAKFGSYVTSGVLIVDYSKYKHWIPPSIAPTK